MKKSLTIALLVTSALTMKAGPVTDAILAIEALPNKNMEEMTPEQFGESALYIKSGKTIIVDNTIAPEIDTLVNSLPPESLWLSISQHNEEEVTMYGEKDDEGQEYNIILKISGDDQNLLLLLKGETEMLEHISILE